MSLLHQTFMKERSALSARVLQLMIHILNLTQIKTTLTPNKDKNAYPIIYDIYLDADINL